MVSFTCKTHHRTYLPKAESFLLSAWCCTIPLGSWQVFVLANLAIVVLSQFDITWKCIMAWAIYRNESDFTIARQCQTRSSLNSPGWGGWLVRRSSRTGLSVLRSSGKAAKVLHRIGSYRQNTEECSSSASITMNCKPQLSFVSEFCSRLLTKASPFDLAEILRWSKWPCKFQTVRWWDTRIRSAWVAYAEITGDN